MPIATAIEPLRILVAEDNMVNQALIRRLMEKAGHSVRSPTTGSRCSTPSRKVHYDLIFMDIQMPDMDGFTATAPFASKSAGAAGTSRLSR